MAPVSLQEHCCHHAFRPRVQALHWAPVQSQHHCPSLALPAPPGLGMKPLNSPEAPPPCRLPLLRWDVCGFAPAPAPGTPQTPTIYFSKPRSLIPLQDFPALHVPDISLLHPAPSVSRVPLVMLLDTHWAVSSSDQGPSLTFPSVSRTKPGARLRPGGRYSDCAAAAVAAAARERPGCALFTRDLHSFDPDLWVILVSSALFPALHSCLPAARWPAGCSRAVGESRWLEALSLPERRLKIEPWFGRLSVPAVSFLSHEERGCSGRHVQAQDCAAGEEPNQEAWHTAFWEAACAEEGTQAVESGPPPTPLQQD